MGPQCSLLKWRSRKQPFVPREEDLLAGSTDQDVGDVNICQHQRSGICEGSHPNSYSLLVLISVMLREDKKEEVLMFSLTFSSSKSPESSLGRDFGSAEVDVSQRRKNWVAEWHCHPESFCASGKFLHVTLEIALGSFRTL